MEILFKSIVGEKKSKRDIKAEENAQLFLKKMQDMPAGQQLFIKKQLEVLRKDVVENYPELLE